MLLLLIFLVTAAGLYLLGRWLVKRWKDQELARREQRRAKLAADRLARSLAKPPPGPTNATAPEVVPVQVQDVFAVNQVHWVMTAEEATTLSEELQAQLEKTRAAATEANEINAALQADKDADDSTWSALTRVPTLGEIATLADFQALLASHLQRYQDIIRLRAQLQQGPHKLTLSTNKLSTELNVLQRLLKAVAGHTNTRLPPRLAIVRLIAQQSADALAKRLKELQTVPADIKAYLKTLTPFALPVGSETTHSQALRQEIPALVQNFLTALAAAKASNASWTARETCFTSAYAAVGASISLYSFDTLGREMATVRQRHLDFLSICGKLAQPAAAFALATSDLAAQLAELKAKLPDLSRETALPTDVHAMRYLFNQWYNYLDRVVDYYEKWSKEAVKLAEERRVIRQPAAEGVDVSTLPAQVAAVQEAVTQAVKACFALMPLIKAVQVKVNSWVTATVKPVVLLPQKPTEQEVQRYLGEFRVVAETQIACEEAAQLAVNAARDALKQLKESGTAINNALDKLKTLPLVDNADSLQADVQACQLVSLWIWAQVEAEEKALQSATKNYTPAGWLAKGDDVTDDDAAFAKEIQKLMRSVGFAVAQNGAAEQKYYKAKGVRVPAAQLKDPVLPDHTGSPDFFKLVDELAAFQEEADQIGALKAAQTKEVEAAMRSWNDRAQKVTEARGQLKAKCAVAVIKRGNVKEMKLLITTAQKLEAVLA